MAAAGAGPVGFGYKIAWLAIRPRGRAPADAAGALPVFLDGRGLQMLAKRVLAGQPGTGLLPQVRWTAANAATIAQTAADAAG